MGKKYKICYSGFAYVDADSIEEAKVNFLKELIAYGECSIDSIEKVDETEVNV